MKLIAQSQVPPRLPYVHLGYSAATIWRPQPDLQFTGHVLIVIGVVVALICRAVGRVLPGARGVMLVLTFVAFPALVICGISILNVAQDYGRRQSVRPVSATQGTILNLHSYLGEPFPSWRDQRRRIPRRPGSFSITSVVLPLPAGYDPDSVDRYLKDGWFHPLRLQVIADGERFSCTVISAGEDANFGTPDDILGDKPFYLMTEEEETVKLLDRLCYYLEYPSDRAILAKLNLAPDQDHPFPESFASCYGTTDAWDRPIWIRCPSDGNPLLISAGEDGEIGTDDDIVKPVPPAKPE